MLRNARNLINLALIAALSACGGGGSSAPLASGVTPSPPASSTCSLRARQDFAFATLNEWYLFPETLPASLDPTPFVNVQDYLSALTATARAQGRDRNFTFITSIAEENAFFNSGTSKIACEMEMLRPRTGGGMSFAIFSTSA